MNIFLLALLLMAAGAVATGVIALRPVTAARNRTANTLGPGVAAIACLLGWLLHLLLSKMNKSVGSMVFMVAFLGIYFYIYSPANSILTSMAQNGQAIADALHSWAWPLYAAGRGCIGSVGLLAIFLAIGAAALGLVWLFLSATFLRTATARRSGRRKKLSLKESAQRSPIGAIIRKELGKFFGTPVYLTNMGLGILMLVALTVAGIIFREDVSMLLMLLGLDGSSRYLIILAIFSYLGATLCISTPSVSLEGKNIWILKKILNPFQNIVQDVHLKILAEKELGS